MTNVLWQNDAEHHRRMQAIKTARELLAQCDGDYERAIELVLLNVPRVGAARIERCLVQLSQEAAS